MCLGLGHWAWLVIAFLMRPYLVIGMSLTNRGDRMELLNLVYADRLWLSIDTLAALPAVMVAIAYARRKPGAPAWVRRLWRSGRVALLSSAGLNALVAAASLFHSTNVQPSFVSPLLLCISLWCLWYLVVAKRVHDAFNDFPNPHDSAESER